MQVTFKGSPLNTIGSIPQVGASAPGFTLTKTDLSNIKLEDFKGKNIILNIFISIDTPVCASSVRKFNEHASKIGNSVVICVSQDLPFAHQRHCAAEGINNVISVSAFRNPEFGKDYGLTIVDGALSGLLSRAIVIISPDQKIMYTEQVLELTDEPNYDKALKTLS